jgi:hypothetical protein
MDESNFFLDTNGKMCIVDFEMVGLLPESFASYTVHSKLDNFAREVAGYLDWSPSPNHYSMARAGVILNTVGDTTLGTSTSTRHRISINYGDRFGRGWPA